MLHQGLGFGLSLLPTTPKIFPFLQEFADLGIVAPFGESFILEDGIQDNAFVPQGGLGQGGPVAEGAQEVERGVTALEGEAAGRREIGKDLTYELFTAPQPLFSIPDGLVVFVLAGIGQAEGLPVVALGDLVFLGGLVALVLEG